MSDFDFTTNCSLEEWLFWVAAPIAIGAAIGCWLTGIWP